MALAELVKRPDLLFARLAKKKPGLSEARILALASTSLLPRTDMRCTSYTNASP